MAAEEDGNLILEDAEKLLKQEADILTDEPVDADERTDVLTGDKNPDQEEPSA